MMTLTRRSFMETTLTASALASLVSLAEASGAVTSPKEPQARPASQGDLPVQDAAAFWDQFYDDFSPRETVRSKPREEDKVPAERFAQILQMGSNGLRPIEQILPAELLDHSGDVQVSIGLGEFRGGTEDARHIQKVKNSQLEVSCKQTKSYMDILAPLMWSALVALKPDAAGRISLQALGFTSPETVHGITRIVLPGGMGKLGVNIHTNPEDSLMQKLLRGSIQGMTALAPVLNFPAVSLAASRVVSMMYAKLAQSHSHILLAPPTPFIATRQASSDLEQINMKYLPLIHGEYVLVPKLHYTDLKPHLHDLEIKEGYLVFRDSSSVDTVEERKDKVAPGVTYATLLIQISPLTTGSGTGNRNASGDDTSAAEGGGAAGASNSKSAGGTKPKAGSTPPCGPNQSKEPSDDKKKKNP